MGLIVEKALKTPMEVPVPGEEWGRRELVDPRVDGVFTDGCFLGLTVEAAEDFERDYERDVSAYGEELASEGAWYALSDGKSLADLFRMWAWAKTKQFGKLKLVPTYSQAELIELIMKAFREDTPLYILLLKARQLGGSTALQIIWMLLASVMEFCNFLTMAHKRDKTGGLFAMQKSAWLFMPFRPRVLWSPSRAPAARFVLSGSESFIESAEDSDPAHSSSYRFAHLSEHARYGEAERVDAAVGATLPDAGFYVLVKETTGNGIGNQFYRNWTDAEKGKNEFTALFHTWFRHKRYRKKMTEVIERELRNGDHSNELEAIEKEFSLQPEQMAWYVHVLMTKYGGDIDLMKENYPSYALQAFLSSGRPVFGTRAFERMLGAMRLDPVFQGDIVIPA